MEINSYFCTRPKLASYLIEHGFKAEKTTNPFNNEKSVAWLFEKTPELKRSVSRFLDGGELDD